MDNQTIYQMNTENLSSSVCTSDTDLDIIIQQNNKLDFNEINFEPYQEFELDDDIRIILENEVELLL